MMKLGVLGGTFDPVHLGHIMMAEEARDRLSLARVLLVPAGRPLTKQRYRATPARHRLRMLRLAVAGRPSLSISTMEIDRPGPSYTVDTIAALRHQHNPEDEIYFILGWDSLAQITQWHQPERIIEMCYLVAVPRPGYTRPDLAEIEAGIPGISRRVVFLERPWIDVSATAIRERVARGESIADLVSGPVADYIKKHKLYQAQ